MGTEPTNKRFVDLLADDIRALLQELTDGDCCAPPKEFGCLVTRSPPAATKNPHIEREERPLGLDSTKCWEYSCDTRLEGRFGG